jgi:excisionase family DNA binding protein
MADAAQHQAPAAAPALLYRLKEAGEALRLSRTMIYRLVKSGDLEQVKIGDATRITVASVQALIERNKQKKAA